MSMNPSEVDVKVIGQTESEGEVVNALAAKIEEVLMGSSMDAAIAACLAIAVLNIRPDLRDSLPDAIFETSQFICMLQAPEAASIEVPVIIPGGAN